LLIAEPQPFLRSEDAHVSAYKTFVTFFALAVIALIASATPTQAQGYHGHSHVVVTGGYYYANPYFFAGYGYPYPWAPYPPYGYYGFDPDASLRIEVTPRDAEVYVDGYYAGTVDDFDGTFQRLHIDTAGTKSRSTRRAFGHYARRSI
jgi:hypothetical protein